MMNLAPPPRKLTAYDNLLTTAVTQVAKKSMEAAIQESIELNENSRDLCIALDGSWQKRGHTSLNGVVSATSIENCKVTKEIVIHLHGN